jgi:hypothetical protein
MTTSVVDQIGQGRADLSRLAARLARHSSKLPPVMDALEATRGGARLRCAKVLLLLSEKAPAVRYPCFEVFAGLLEDQNHIIRWNAIRVLANLASVDAEARVERILDKYLSFIKGPVMITAANVILGAAKIARAKPNLTARITAAILQVEKANYATRECRNVAIGHALTALRSLGAAVAARQDVLAFAQRVNKRLGLPRTGTS